MALLTVNHLSKSFGTRTLFEDVCFEVGARDKLGLVGVNGCGKSTLLHMLTGKESRDAGTVFFARDVNLVTMEQSVVNTKQSLFEATLAVFSALIDMEAEIESIDDALSLSPADPLPLLAREQSLRERFEAGGGLTYKSRTRSTLLGLGFSEEELGKPLEEMSGGQRNKAQLARILLSNANFMLLDEPTNHLDIDAIAFLEDFLLAYRGAFIVISHDRYFLDKVTNKTIEIKNGRAICSAGNYSRHIELQSSEKEVLRRRYVATQREIRRIEGIIAQQRHFAMERNFITIASKQKQIERLKETLVAPEKEPEGIRFHFKARETGGNDVLFCEDLAKRYEKTVFQNVNIHLRRGERVFLLGANGCGKTTLLRIIIGEEEPDRGEVRLGAHVHPGYYEQHMRSLHEGNTVISEIWDEYPKYDNTQIRSALAAFLFRGDEVKKSIATLSGGEKARVQLLKLMLAEDNLLLLDEPTNHLDIASREALEKALEEHEGTMLIVTHDRYLVNRLADRILVLSENGISEYQGGYDDYLSAKKEALARSDKDAKSGTKQNSYAQQKKLQNEINLAAGEVRRTEEKIAHAESELSAIQENMALYAADYARVQSLFEDEKKKRLEIEALYEKWEEAQRRLDQLQGEA